MGKQRTKRARPQKEMQTDGRGNSSRQGEPLLSRRKLWLFRLLALIGAPILFAGVLELALRISGYGYPTGFLQPASSNGEEVFVQNNRFGWRFFGREMARWPYPFTITQAKATNVVRIFVLGESAARGEPQPAFGFPRVLQAMLSLKYPLARFEVVNAAMTAINSHTILPIARDCAKAGGDIWVIYMGNNEVVGPFGAGTVFGSQAPPLPLVKTSLALKATRTGQLLDSAVQRMQKGGQDDGVWGGMTLFLNQQVRADDPRLNQVYHHFERNLGDILEVGKEAHLGIVLSTVAVNLKDCPPFASAHREGVSTNDLGLWKRAYQSGVAAYEAGRLQEAAGHFSEAAKVDDTFAELRYRQAQCAAKLGALEEARLHFQAACDYDTLRFRCDSRLNEIIRQKANLADKNQFQFVDAGKVFAEQSSGGVPGDGWFYEHVHFTFDGNYLLAGIIAEQIEKLLPDWVKRQSSNGSWPSQADCEHRLGWTDWNKATSLNSIIATVSDPPFSGQIEHQEKMTRLEKSLAQLASAYEPNGITRALNSTEAALEKSPSDPTLLKQLATLQKKLGDFVGAEAAVRKVLNFCPQDMDAWALWGTILSEQHHPEQAEMAFRKAFELGTQGIRSNLELANSLAALGKTDQAIAEYHRILRMKPRYVPALLKLGLLLEAMGRKSDAEKCFDDALARRSHRLPELMELGEFFERRHAFLPASQVYQDAVNLNSSDARLHLSVARNLASLGRYKDAAPYSAEAVRLSPEVAEMRLMDGIILWKSGKVIQAMERFQEGLQLQPESLDARLNLGMALSQQGRNSEALVMFQQVLDLSPTNVMALKYAESLRTKLQSR